MTQKRFENLISHLELMLKEKNPNGFSGHALEIIQGVYGNNVLIIPQTVRTLGKPNENNTLSLQERVRLLRSLGITLFSPFVIQRSGQRHTSYQLGLLPTGWSLNKESLVITDRQKRIRGMISKDFNNICFFCAFQIANTKEDAYNTQLGVYLWQGTCSIAKVTSCGNLLRTTSTFWWQGDSTTEELAEFYRSARAELSDWLDVYFPDWADPCAYWSLTTTIAQELIAQNSVHIQQSSLVS